MTGPRTYDPLLGRFLQPDPLVQPGEGPFVYASGNPIRLADPGGYTPADVCTANNPKGDPAPDAVHSSSIVEIASTPSAPARAVTDPTVGRALRFMVEGMVGAFDHHGALSSELAAAAETAQDVSESVSRSSGSGALADVFAVAPGLRAAGAMRGSSKASFPRRHRRGGILSGGGKPRPNRGVLNNNYSPREMGDPDFSISIDGYAYAEANLVEDGVLIFDIHAKAARAAGHSGASGGFAFQTILRAAEDTGDLRSIRAVWIEGDNLEAFRAAGGGPSATAATNNAAARTTFTGREAHRAGYTELTVSSGEGMTTVLFTRPGG